jgi:RNA polymerase sigma-70 factor (ECF subfamily)
VSDVGRTNVTDADPGGDAETFDTLRPYLFSIAYRMLGTVSDAEDIVQEAYVRYERALRAGTSIDSLRAYLAAVVTRLAIDLQRSARVRRESYVGEWLPEPLLTGDDGGAGAIAVDPAAHAEQADSLSMAFLLVLDTLNPVERAVFLLHDVFGYGYDRVAEIVGRTEANCRQIAVRARRRVEGERPHLDAGRRASREVADRFVAAMVAGDVERLEGMLAADVVVHGDGGGKAPQWSKPIVGARRVARLLANVGRQLEGFEVRPQEINGQPGALVLDPDGRLVNVFSLDIVDGAVQTVRSVINPDKLRHIGPVADAWALLRARQADRGAPSAPPPTE